MFLNFHTHADHKSVEGISVRNLIVGLDLHNESDPLAEDGLFSVGIHPWYFDEQDVESKLQLLENVAQSKRVKLIGECGLDRLKGPSLLLQQAIFEKQIALAEKVRKPVLVHCVKCYSELLAIKKKLQPQIPLVVHGFNNKPELGGQLLDAGFYFSLGTAILRQESNAAQLLQRIPLNRLFLETDDKGNAIEEVYEAAAVITKTPLNELKDNIFANWMSLNNGS